MSDEKPVFEESTELEHITVPENSRKHFKYRSNTCLNCDHPLDLSDRYCPYCSQLNSTKPLSFKDFFGEFFNSIISYDSRLRYTVRDLLFKPGTITHKFVNGQRLRYANPFRFFLSVSIIFFLLNELTNTLTGDDNINFNTPEKIDDGVIKWPNGNGTDSINIKDEIEKAKALKNAIDVKDPEASIAIVENALGANTTETKTLETEAIEAKKKADDSLWAEMNKGFKKDYKKDFDGSKQQPEKNAVAKTNIDKGVINEPKNQKNSLPEAKVEKDLAVETKLKKDSVKTKAPSYLTQAAIDSTGYVKSIAERLNAYWDFYDHTEIKDPIKALDSLGHEKSKTNVWLYEKNFAMERFKDKPSDFVSYVLNKVPFFLFFFTPFFAFFFWLIHSKKKYTYMEHNVFIFHIFSFLFLGAIIAILPDALLGNQIVLSLLLGLVAPFYFYKALRNFYKQGRLITIIKFVFLNIVFLISSTFAATVFFLITAATF